MLLERAQYLHFSVINDVLVLIIEADDKKTLTMTEFDKITNEQFQTIVLSSYNSWSVEFINSFYQILTMEFNETPISNDYDVTDKINELGRLVQNILNIKKAKASI